MALFDALSNTTDENASATLYALLKGLRAKVTRATVRESLLQHPDFPSLLSLSDVLTDWRVENTGLQLNTTEQLRELPLPFIAHLRKNNGWYVLVNGLQGDTITYTDSGVGRKIESLSDFEQKWSGVVLLAEADGQSGETDYTTKRIQERLDEVRQPFLLIGALLISLFVLPSVAKNLTAPDWLLIVSKATGLILSSLLVANQLGSKNALTDRLCRINSKTNCDDVLNSPAAKLWGWLSWTDVGLIYFAGGLFTVLLMGVQPPLRPLLHWLALLALPYTLFSVYYQGFVLRQWCPLCLGVQSILLMEGVLAATQLSPLTDFVTPYLLALIAFLLPTLIWVFVKTLLVNIAKSRRMYEELMRFKRDPALFQILLMQQPQMPPIPNDMHPIVLGNPNAEHTITVVANPYCIPCAKTHKELDRLLSRIISAKATIIFTCDGADGPETRFALHTAALTKQDKAAIALKEWYERPEKNYHVWANRFPADIAGLSLTTTSEQHSQWCLIAGITNTPTIYVEGYKLPTLYDLGNLRWLISELEPGREVSNVCV